MAKAAAKAKGNRLKRSTILTLPNQNGKSMRVWFPAEFGDRIGNSATIKIEQFNANGDVLRTWTSGTPLQNANSPYGGNAKVYYTDVSTADAISLRQGQGKGKRKKGLGPGDLILVTITVTVPVTAMEPETSDIFEIEATTIDLP
jgi:hypothetical protein